MLQRAEFNSGGRAKTYGDFASLSFFSATSFFVSNPVFDRPMDLSAETVLALALSRGQLVLYMYTMSCHGFLAP